MSLASKLLIFALLRRFFGGVAGGVASMAGTQHARATFSSMRHVTTHGQISFFISIIYQKYTVYKNINKTADELKLLTHIMISAVSLQLKTPLFGRFQGNGRKSAA